MKISKSGTELWISLKDSIITVLDTQQWHVKKMISCRNGDIQTMCDLSTAFSMEILKSVWIAVSNTNGLVIISENTFDKIINVKSNILPLKLIKCISISLDGKHLALIGKSDGSLKLFSTKHLLHQIFQREKQSKNDIYLQLKQDSSAFDDKVI